MPNFIKIPPGGGTSIGFSDEAIKFPTGYVISFERKSISDVKSLGGIPLTAVMTTGYTHSGQKTTWNKNASSGGVSKLMLSMYIDGASGYAYVQQSSEVNFNLMDLFKCDWEKMKQITFGGNSGATILINMWLKPN